MQRRHGEERDGTYRIDESSFAPITCEFWQENRIPPSGYPRAQFVRWLPSDSEKNYYINDLGGEAFSNHYAAGWAWATNTPFQWSKQVASHLGGTRDPLIVSWPGHIKDAGGLRSQFHHVTDIAPTIYELAGVGFPAEVNGVKQLPLEGKSLVYSFDHPNTSSPHTVQYFEMVGNRGIYKDGWWAGSRNLVPWALRDLWSGKAPAPHPWELYNLNEDYSQAHNLAAKYPEKLKQLQDLFDSEARRNNRLSLGSISIPPAHAI